jgi:hypothetical protein
MGGVLGALACSWTSAELIRGIHFTRILAQCKVAFQLSRNFVVFLKMSNA